MLSVDHWLSGEDLPPFPVKIAESRCLGSEIQQSLPEMRLNKHSFLQNKLEQEQECIVMYLHSVLTYCLVLIIRTYFEKVHCSKMMGVR